MEWSGMYIRYIQAPYVCSNGSFKIISSFLLRLLDLLGPETWFTLIWGWSQTGPETWFTQKMGLLWVDICEYVNHSRATSGNHIESDSPLETNSKRTRLNHHKYVVQKGAPSYFHEFLTPVNIVIYHIISCVISCIISNSKYIIEYIYISLINTRFHLRLSSASAWKHSAW